MDSALEIGWGHDSIVLAQVRQLFNTSRVFWLYKSSKTLVGMLCSNRHGQRSLRDQSDYQADVPACYNHAQCASDCWGRLSHFYSPKIPLSQLKLGNTFSLQHFPPAISNIQNIVKHFLKKRCWNFLQQSGSQGLKAGNSHSSPSWGNSYGYTSRILTMDLFQHSYLKESLISFLYICQGISGIFAFFNEGQCWRLICLIQPS